MSLDGVGGPPAAGLLLLPGWRLLLRWPQGCALIDDSTVEAADGRRGRMCLRMALGPGAENQHGLPRETSRPALRVRDNSGSDLNLHPQTTHAHPPMQHLKYCHLVEPQRKRLVPPGKGQCAFPKISMVVVFKRSVGPEEVVSSGKPTL